MSNISPTDTSFTTSSVEGPIRNVPSESTISSSIIAAQEDSPMEFNQTLHVSACNTPTKQAKKKNKERNEKHTRELTFTQPISKRRKQLRKPATSIEFPCKMQEESNHFSLDLNADDEPSNETNQTPKEEAVANPYVKSERKRHAIRCHACEGCTPKQKTKSKEVIDLTAE